MDQLKNTAENAVRQSLKRGASTVDVLIREDDTFSVNVRKGEIETLKQAISRSMLLRVFVGSRTATCSTSDLSDPVVHQLIDDTVAMAKLTSEDQSGGLPDASLFHSHLPDLDLLDPAWEKLTPQDRINMALHAEDAALKFDSRIVNSEGASFDYGRSRTVIANSLGFAGEYEGTGAGLSVSPVAQSGNAMQRDFWMSASRHLATLGTPDDVGRIAAERTLRRLDARKVSTCEVPVVFDPVTAASLVSHILQAATGDSIYRKTSFLVDALNHQVASANVTILDDALLSRGLGSSPFDDEGVPTSTTTVIETGILRNYLHSAYSARKLGAKPTGNGMRASTGAVTIGPTNFYLKPGIYSPEEIIGSIKSGLYVVELIGPGVNIVNGDYSRGAVGLWIEDGRLTHAVQEITIAGSLRRMMKDVEMIGNDLVFLGSVASPTVKISKMVVSGD